MRVAGSVVFSRMGSSSERASVVWPELVRMEIRATVRLSDVMWSSA